MGGVEGFKLLVSIPLPGGLLRTVEQEEVEVEDDKEVEEESLRKKCLECRQEEERRERRRRWLPSSSSTSHYLLQSSNTIACRPSPHCPTPPRPPSCALHRAPPPTFQHSLPLRPRPQPLQRIVSTLLPRPPPRPSPQYLSTYHQSFAPRPAPPLIPNPTKFEGPTRPCLFTYLEEHGLLVVGLMSGELVVYLHQDRVAVVRWAPPSPSRLGLEPVVGLEHLQGWDPFYPELGGLGPSGQGGHGGQGPVSLMLGLAGEEAVVWRVVGAGLGVQARLVPRHGAGTLTCGVIARTLSTIFLGAASGNILAFPARLPPAAMGGHQVAGRCHLPRSPTTPCTATWAASCSSPPPASATPLSAWAPTGLPRWRGWR